MKYVRLACTVCVRFYHWTACINRLLAIAFLAALVLYGFFYWYDSGSNQTVDQIVSGLLAICFVAVVVHMFWDRGVQVWSAPAIGILYVMIAMSAVFLTFFINWHYGHIPPGKSQALYDIARTAGFIGAPLLIFSVIAFRVRKLRAGDEAKPGELLFTGGRAAPPTEERRQYDRREETREMKQELSRLRTNPDG